MAHAEPRCSRSAGQSRISPLGPSPSDFLCLRWQVLQTMGHDVGEQTQQSVGPVHIFCEQTPRRVGRSSPHSTETMPNKPYVYLSLS
jgi:hypothetical protein